eukprot:2847373-Amphidinium_carterae.1
MPRNHALDHGNPHKRHTTAKPSARPLPSQGSTAVRALYLYNELLLQATQPSRALPIRWLICWQSFRGLRGACPLISLIELSLYIVGGIVAVILWVVHWVMQGIRNKNLGNEPE